MQRPKKYTLTDSPKDLSYGMPAGYAKPDAERMEHPHPNNSEAFKRWREDPSLRKHLNWEAIAEQFFSAS